MVGVRIMKYVNLEIKDAITNEVLSNSKCLILPPDMSLDELERFLSMSPDEMRQELEKATLQSV